MAYAKVCLIKYCPNKTVARVADKNNEKRRDLCLGHAKAALRHYGTENVVVIDNWGGTKKSDFNIAQIWGATPAPVENGESNGTAE